MIHVTTREIAQYHNNQIIEYRIKNDNGMEVVILNYGCTISRWTAKDRNGVYQNVVLGFDEFDKYLTHSSYFGAVIGRVAGRIDQARFSLQGKTFHLEANEGTSTLHGGNVGFDKMEW